MNEKIRFSAEIGWDTSHSAKLQDTSTWYASDV